MCGVAAVRLSTGGDCDDGNPDVYPHHEEICDGLDNDCDGTLTDQEFDDDGDGPAEGAGDCDVWADGDPAYLGMDDPTGARGNLGVSPSFTNPSWPGNDPTAWDLHLDPGSPVVDAGHPGVVDPDGGRSDMGAYGGPGAAGWDLDHDGFFEWWLPGPYDPATSPGMDCDDRDPTIHPGSGCESNHKAM